MKYVALLAVVFSILGFTHINTDISYEHMISMGIPLVLAIAIPVLVTRYIFKENILQFHWIGNAKVWDRRHIGYLFFAFVAAYLIIPFYLRDTGAYQNWTVVLEQSYIIRLFIGTNALGIWDELFFINTLLPILMIWLRFPVANAIQGVFFTLFLFELGFTGWGPFMVYPFAVLQGIVYQRTQSLLYVIAIHLLVDLVLFLALINAHHPEVLDIFIT